MPTNQHTARQMDPKECTGGIRVGLNAFGPGVDAQWCIRPGKPVAVQSIHFDPEKFTAEEAKAWLKKHDYSAAEFVPASGPPTKAAAVTGQMKDVSKCPRGAECPMMQEGGDAMGACGTPGIHPVNLAASGLPAVLQLACGPLELQAASTEGGVQKRGVAMTAYTGAAMRLPGFMHPVVVDLSGMKMASQRLPILRQHDPERIIGHTSGVDVSAQRLKASGSLVGLTPAGAEVLALAAADFPWQVSLGADVNQMEFVDKGASAKVNGRNFDGPCYVAKGTALRELSIVPMGADASTSATIAGDGTPDLTATDIQAAFVHNSETSKSEPDWGGVDKAALPSLAFADHTGQQSEWSYPHHWVENAGGKDKDGNWTTGTLLLHKGGLNAAWAAANGAHTGKKANSAVIAHLEAHRKALGLDKKAAGAGGAGFDPFQRAEV